MSVDDEVCCNTTILEQLYGCAHLCMQARTGGNQTVLHQQTFSPQSVSLWTLAHNIVVNSPLTPVFAAALQLKPQATKLSHAEHCGLLFPLLSSAGRVFKKITQIPWEGNHKK